MLSSKRKNDDKRKGLPRRVSLIVGITVIALLLLAAGIFLSQPRFTPMSDIPNDDLIYMEQGEGYRLDFQTGQRIPEAIPTDMIPELFDWNETSPDGRWRVSFDWVELGVKASLQLEDFTQKDPLPVRILGTFGAFYSGNNLFSWSTDQQWVAFGAQAYTPESDATTSDHSEIWIVNIATGQSKQLTSNAYSDVEPVFSPDGAQIAYTSSADGTPRVYILDIATGETRLFTPDQYATNPRWSPDGQWIAYEVWYTTNYIAHINLYVMRVDGTHPQSITITGNSAQVIGWKS
jgi:WD40 repeat protein